MQIKELFGKALKTFFPDYSEEILKAATISRMAKEAFKTLEESEGYINCGGTLKNTWKGAQLCHGTAVIDLQPTNDNCMVIRAAHLHTNPMRWVPWPAWQSSNIAGIVIEATDRIILPMDSEAIENLVKIFDDVNTKVAYPVSRGLSLVAC